ncbi:hypothetical protein Esi_0000_0382 [Ectocarpus siliculosus]|uniref:Uncharacterized protein n=1 Tax=Ectocarpus siliculosus TaxID=2880 RepID=D8LBC9_ECTSI|nr:hypothetical protein Esi_0000_0382 [Ectocarpus siliculosus]|eukprot:CBN76638.1 hypothetical protein Esi_0000_0382 [Ectocarpus siliculosus]
MRTRGRALKDPEPVVEVTLEEAKGSAITKDTPAAAPQAEESKGEETAPVATAVESAEAKAADATISGENGNGIAPPAGAAADNSGANSNNGDDKPPIQNNLEGAAAVSAADDDKPTNAVAGASNSNGTAAATSIGPGNGEVAAAGTAVEKEGAENGEITAGDIKAGKDDENSGGEEGKKTGGAAAGDADMEVEPPPKEDVMVDYTDEFGRVRQMLQRGGTATETGGVVVTTGVVEGSNAGTPDDDHV